MPVAYHRFAGGSLDRLARGGDQLTRGVRARPVVDGDDPPAGGFAASGTAADGSRFWSAAGVSVGATETPAAS